LVSQRLLHTLFPMRRHVELVHACFFCSTFTFIVLLQCGCFSASFHFLWLVPFHLS
jgi:hypothetical protein